MTSPSTPSTANRRICIVAPEFIGPFPNGGVGTACYWEAFTLGTSGFDVTVLYTGPTQAETPDHWETHFAGAPFRYIDLSRWIAREGSPSHLDGMVLPCPEARIAELVLTFLRTVDVDLVMFQEFLGHGARALQARAAGDALRGVRATTTMHSCRQWIYEGMHRLPSSPADVAVDFLERESSRLADRVVAPSRHMAEWASRRWRLDGAAVIPYCYDESLAKPRTPIEHAGPFTHLVFFGRLETRKGVQVFCRALAANPGLQRQVSTVTFLGKPSSVDGLSSEAFIAAAMAQVPGVAWTIKGNLGSFEALAWLAAQTNVLVVTPSLVDNLPYTMIELHSRRIPFVATRIGGIPEVVGEANAHLLADPAPEALAAVLARVTAGRPLTIDYRSGYDVSSANTLHVQFVAEALAEPASAVQDAHDVPFSVVVTHGSEEDVVRLRERVTAVDAAASGARWEGFEDWRSSPENLRAVFLDARVEPLPGLVTRLLEAVAQPGVNVATSYYHRDDAGQVTVETPLGGALEIGWSRNCFGGPCFAVDAAAAARIVQAMAHGRFTLWPAYAAMACAGLAFTVVPDPLYRVDGDALDAFTHDDVEAVIAHYHSAAPGRLDLGWVLKSAMGSALAGAAGARTGDSLGRALYERFVSTPDDLIGAYAALDPAAASDPYVRQLAHLRGRLQEMAARWRTEEPQVWIYGAGQHAKLIFSLCPELGPFVAGFIDRRPMARFLGRPCVTPEQFRHEMGDVILYSSREYEGEMHAAMQQMRVEHVLLYQQSPQAAAATTSSRLQRRFGHAAPDLAAMRAMYAPPAWATGYISGSDADFLVEMVAAQGPRMVVELGVASGASSAVILHALDQLPEPEQRLLISCDVTPACYFNADYATGQATREMYPGARAQWQLQTDTDARRLSRQLPPASVDLTFIDANHLHPWPLLDLLHLAAIARPGSWVVLHDIELPVQHPEFQVFGPRWLFAAWPFAKVKGIGRWTSIGAVQLPRTLSELVPIALSLLERPWESSLPDEAAELPEALDAVAAALRARGDADVQTAAQASLEQHR